jgi:hypothetical protein
VAYDPASQTFTASTVGSYRLQFSCAQAVVDVVNVADANLALGKTATATTTRDNNVASNVTDGNTSTRWESEWTDNQSITIDLESPYVLNRVIMTWEGAYASNYDILVSLNGEEWTSVWHTSQGRGGNVTAEFSATAGRYVKLQCNSRGTGYGNSLYEIEVYGLSRYEDVVSVANVACDMAPVDVYNLQGLCLRRAVPAANALAGLPSGLYIVNNKKIMKH